MTQGAENSRLNVLRYPDADEVTRAAAEYLVGRARAAVVEGGRFRVALSGGRTPIDLFGRLGRHPFLDQMPWRYIDVFWGDERYVPHDDPQSNYRLARDTFLAKVPIPPEQVYPMPTDSPDPRAAAIAHEQTIRRVFSLAPGEWPRFDLILLGLGPDGHTASLFPGSPALRAREYIVAAPYVPFLTAYRLTLTLPVINRARAVLFVVVGADKAEVVRAVLKGPARGEDLPAQLVQPEAGELIWMLDQHAARLL